MEIGLSYKINLGLTIGSTELSVRFSDADFEGSAVQLSHDDPQLRAAQLTVEAYKKILAFRVLNHDLTKDQALASMSQVRKVFGVYKAEALESTNDVTANV